MTVQFRCAWCRDVGFGTSLKTYGGKWVTVTDEWRELDSMPWCGKCDPRGFEAFTTDAYKPQP